MSEPRKSRATTATPTHWPQLDGLRALAVLAVLYTHYLPEKYWVLGIYWGGYGVRLFFVLSGFLITGILLRSRQFIALGQHPFFALRQFYVRRFLRIFPIYYLTLAITAILAIPPVRATILWNVSYLSNVYFARRGDFNGTISHLWSLSVEEQFYLFWPCLILFLPSRFLRPSIIAGIAAAPLFRVVGKVVGLGNVALWVLTPSLLDTLCLGALLACISGRGENTNVSTKALCRVFLVFGLSLVCLLQIVPLSLQDSLPVWFVSDLGRGLVFTWLVASGADGFGGVIGRVLTCRPLVYIGKVSYGVYLFHPFIEWICSRQLVGTFVAASPVLACFTYTAITVAAASLSWEIFEKRVNRLKRYFDYDGTRMLVPIAASASQRTAGQRQ